MNINIEDIPFFSGLSKQEIDTFKPYLVKRSYKKGTSIHRDGDPCASIFFVGAGRVKLFRNSTEGKEQIYEILGPGDTCACNPGETDWCCGSNAEVLSESTLWFLPRATYLSLLQGQPKLPHALNQILAKRLQKFSTIIEEVTLMDSEKRVVKFLLDMLLEKHVQSPQSDILFIEATREEIAHRLGTTRETVARHISDLKRQKLIDVKPYQIIILNQKKLEKLLDTPR